MPLLMYPLVKILKSNIQSLNDQFINNVIINVENNALIRVSFLVTYCVG